MGSLSLFYGHNTKRYALGIAFYVNWCCVVSDQDHLGLSRLDYDVSSLFFGSYRSIGGRWEP